MLVAHGVMDHPFCYNEAAWRRLKPEFLAFGGTPNTATAGDYYGGVELQEAPPRPTAEEEIAWDRLREFIAKGATSEHADPARVYGIKRIPSFNILPY
jgi:hypothetical protein